MPHDAKKYPIIWKDVIRPLILFRDNYRCALCGSNHYSFTENVSSPVYLSVAHRDHNLDNSRISNLSSLCQSCHNKFDSINRIKTRLVNRVSPNDTKHIISLYNVHNQSHAVTFQAVIKQLKSRSQLDLFLESIPDDIFL